MSLKVKVYNLEGKAVAEKELSPKIFNVAAKPEVVHQALVALLGNQRQILADTKDKGEVRGGGKKPWRQKGTGRARHGSIRSPLWIGGGVTFGPTTDRNYKKKINKKANQKAMFMCLSDKLANDQMIILEDMILPEIKTKSMVAVLKKMGLTDQKTLLVMNGKSEAVVKSGRNLSKFKIINLENINVYELLNCQKLILTVPSVDKLEATYNK